MKDYTLSEMIAHCKEMHKKYGNKACDNCGGEKARFCENQFANIPQNWTDEYDIEPRDIMELPYKQRKVDLCKKPFWRVFYRKNGEVFIQDFIKTEAEADNFIQELKGKEQ